MAPTCEQEAWRNIDRMLEQAGWIIQDRQHINLGIGPGIAVREYHTQSGPADYILFVDRRPVGVIEAKKENLGESLSTYEDQADRYASSGLKWRVALRTKHPNTIWVKLFQLNACGGMRNGIAAEFDAPVVLKAVFVDPALQQNYVYVEKNRGNDLTRKYLIVERRAGQLFEEEQQ